MELSHDRLPTPTLLTVGIRVISGSGYLNGLSVSYGNEQRYAENPVAAACPAQLPSSSPTPSPASTATRTLLVSYRFPGVYRINVTAQADQSECAPTRYPTEQLQTSLTVRITNGQLLANGPQLPGGADVSGDPGISHPSAGVTYLLAVTSGDPDGVITGYRWNWGDGSPPFVQQVPAGMCRDDGRSWPTTTNTTLDYASHAQHRYPRAEVYSVQVTVVSGGCKGQDLQSLTTSTSIHSGDY